MIDIDAGGLSWQPHPTPTRPHYGVAATQASRRYLEVEPQERKINRLVDSTQREVIESRIRARRGARRTASSWDRSCLQQLERVRVHPTASTLHPVELCSGAG